MMKVSYSKKVAFSGVITALCIALMFSSAIIPILSYTLPAVCGLILLITSLAVGEKYAYVSYVAVSILSLFFVPDKECMLLFISFFGYYPILKKRIEKIKIKSIMYLIKLVIFNVSFILTQILLIKIFGIMIFDEFDSKWVIIVLMIFINIFFIVFDKVLYLFEQMYKLKLQKTLKKLLK